MNIKEFTERVKKEMENRTGFSVEAKEVLKNNNTVLNGISVLNPNSNIAPTFYVNSYFEAYEKGVISFEDVIERILETYEKEGNVSVNMEWFREWDIVKSKVAFKVINFESNKELLKTAPHEVVMDLAKVYFVSVKEDFGNGSILINNNHIDMWGISREELNEVAMENTPQLFPAEVKDMMDMIGDLLNDEDISVDIEACPVSMYVATNTDRIYGAAVMLYPDVMDKVAKRLNGDLFILPSSIHECIILKADIKDEAENLRNMVYEVNRSQVIAEEVLSDSVYYYNRENGLITVV